MRESRESFGAIAFVDWFMVLNGGESFGGYDFGDGLMVVVVVVVVGLWSSDGG